LAEGGVDLSEMEYTIDDIPAEFLQKIDEIRQMIINGEITVTDVTKE
jgi:basic membrane protein A